MPHVIIRHPPAIEDCFRSLRPWKERWSDGSLLETRPAYLRGDRQAILIPALCLELGPGIHFFVSIEKKKERITVRIFPHPSPPRTPGVQGIVARIAREVLILGGEVEKTNLDPLL